MRSPKTIILFRYFAMELDLLKDLAKDSAPCAMLLLLFAIFFSVYNASSKTIPFR